MVSKLINQSRKYNFLYEVLKKLDRLAKLSVDHSWSGGGNFPIFFYGDLASLYPNDDYTELTAKRKYNWDLLKELVAENKATGTGIQLPNKTIEFYRPVNDNIDLGNNETASLVGRINTTLVFYPFVLRLETGISAVFDLQYGASLSLKNIKAKTPVKQSKLETYNCILKKEGDSKTIELLGDIRPGFWEDLEDLTNCQYSWDYNTLAEINPIDSWDKETKTITVTNNISGSVGSDTEALFSVQFLEHISVQDYETYGQFWSWNKKDNIKGTDFIYNIPASNSGDEISYYFENLILENFERGISISAGNFHVDYKNLICKDTAVGFSAFARSQMNGQYIKGTNMSFISTGYSQIAQVHALDAGNFGSGSYFHPTIIFEEHGLLYLKDNYTSGFRQYSASIEEVMEGVSSYFKEVYAEGGVEYDLYTSNCMPVTIDKINCNDLRIGGSLTINEGTVTGPIIGSVALEPPNGTPVNWTFNNLNVFGYVRTAYNILTEEVHEIELNNCNFYTKVVSTDSWVIEPHQRTKQIVFNNCLFKLNPSYTVPNWSPGENIPEGDFAIPFIVQRGQKLEFNNCITDSIKCRFFRYHSVDTMSSDYFGSTTIEFKNSNIALPILQAYPSTGTNILGSSNRNSSSDTKIVSTHTGLGVFLLNNFTFLNNTLSGVSILPSQTIYNTGGVYSPFNQVTVSNVLEVAPNYNEYFVNSGIINRIFLYMYYTDGKKVTAETNFNDIITIHAVGGDLTLNKFNASTNPNGNIMEDIIIPNGESRMLRCNNKIVLSKSANTSDSDVIGTGNGTSTFFRRYINDTVRLIVPESVTITAGDITGTVDADGVISGEGIDSDRSFVDYWSGAIWITFDEPLENGVDIVVDFDKYVDWVATGAWELVE